MRWKEAESCESGGVWELPRVEGGGLRRYRLQSDVFLAVNSVQPDEHKKGFQTNTYAIV